MKARYALFLTLAALLAGGAGAQTVTVDGATNSPPTTFVTITDALNSFDAGASGANSGNPGQPNIIEITAFGPFDEAIPPIGDGGAAGSGITGVQDSPEGFTIRGVGVRPLVLIQINSGVGGNLGANDGLYVVGGSEVTFENLIFACSPTAEVGDDFIRFDDPTVRVTFNNCVVTALPSNSTTFTQESDIPSDLLDGSRLYDATLVRADDNGGFFNDCEVTMINTVWTNQGEGGTPDGAVLSGGSFTTLGPGCVWSSHNRQGFQLGFGDTLTIKGTPDRPVILSGNGLEAAGATSAAIHNFGASASNQTLDIEHAVFSNNQNAINVNGDDPALIDINNVVITDSANDGIALAPSFVTTTAGSYNFDNITILGAGNDLLSATGGAGTVNLKITGSIFGGPAAEGIEAVDAGATIDLTDSALIGSGAFALTTPTAGAGTINQTNVITDDPVFFTTTFIDPAFGTGPARNYLAPTASAYLGDPLITGGFFVESGTFKITVDGNLAEWPKPNWTQAVQTGFGDNSDSDPVTGGGSELDSLRISNTESHLVVALAGNLEPNGNAHQIYFDTDPLASNPKTVFPDPFNQTAFELRAFEGMDGDTLPFEAEYAICFENGGFGPFANFLDFTVVPVSGEDLQAGTVSGSTSGLVDYSLDSARDIQIGFNNSNIGGVEGGSGLEDEEPDNVATGYEVAVPLADLGLSIGDLVQVFALHGSGGGFLSNQALPSLATPLPPQTDPQNIFPNLAGDNSAQDLPALGAVAVATYVVGVPVTSVRDFSLYR